MSKINNTLYEAPICETLTASLDTVLCQSLGGETTPYVPGDDFEW